MDKAWFWALDADHCVEDDVTNVRYLTRLFQTADVTLAQFSDAPADQGLNFIAYHCCSDHSYSVAGDDVDIGERDACIRSMYDLYAKCFDVRCEPALSHLDQGSNPLNRICYMWWDLFAIPTQADTARNRSYCDVSAEVLEKILRLPNPACIEAALHGLNHLQEPLTQRVQTIIDTFLAAEVGLDPALGAFAMKARDGAWA